MTTSKAMLQEIIDVLTHREYVENRELNETGQSWTLRNLLVLQELIETEAQANNSVSCVCK